VAFPQGKLTAYDPLDLIFFTDEICFALNIGIRKSLLINENAWKISAGNIEYVGQNSGYLKISLL